MHQACSIISTKGLLSTDFISQQVWIFHVKVTITLIDEAANGLNCMEKNCRSNSLIRMLATSVFAEI